jgi:hypothetical protein
MAIKKEGRIGHIEKLKKLGAKLLIIIPSSINLDG